MASTQDIEISVGADESDTITVSMGDFNLAAGASGGGETRGTFAAAAALEANLQSALAAGTISVSDGTETISIDLAFVQQSNNDGSITAAAVTHEEVGIALEAAAAAKAAFSIGEFTSSDDDASFALKEKAGLGGTNGTVSFLGHADLVAEANSDMTTGVAATGIGAMGANIADFATAGTGDDVDSTGVIEEIDNAIKGVASARAEFGAVINRLEYTVDSLNTTVLNTQAAKSRIVDADYAAETTELARTQIIAQASTAMLSQANQQAQTVLALLK